MAARRQWCPFECLHDPGVKNIALIKLNTPFDNHKKIFDILWQKAVLKAVVDGAANRLHDCPDLARDEYMPDLINGDFDSAKPEVLTYYRKKGVTIIPTPDQNQTDFTKCIRIVCDKIISSKLQVDCICAHVTFDGRFDHVFGNINSLFLARQMTDLPIYLISGDDVTFLVDKGQSSVHTKSPWRGKSCGLIPMDGACEAVTTRGLKYNLDHQSMRFGGMVSTSNSIVDDTVTIETDNHILVTVSIEADPDL